MCVSHATDRNVAGRIASAHNRHECWACSRELPDGGVLTFGLSGSDARWYEDRETAERKTPGVRYMLEHDGSRDVDVDEVLEFLAAQRDEIDAAIEHLEQQRAERRAEREMRADGITAPTCQCTDCGYPKARPADECERCGDIPVPLGISEQNFNRARGYAF